MKKIVFSLFSLLIIIILLIGIFLSTKGYETTKFNVLISEKVKSVDDNLKLNVKSIKIKLDFKEFKIFLSTVDPKTKYGNVNLPVSQLKIYFDFFSLLKKEPNIKGANIVFDEVRISEIKKLILRIKPSNIKSFISNNISGGKLDGSIKLNFDDNFQLEDYQLTGSLKKTNINLYNRIKIENSSFNFAADKDVVLINSISFNLYGIPVTNGTIQISKKNKFVIEGNLNTEINSDKDKLKKLFELFPNIEFLNNKIKLKGNFLNEFKIILNQTLKLENYSYNLIGSFKDSQIILNKEIKTSLLKNDIKKIFLKNSNVKINFIKNKKTTIFLDGIYKIREKSEFQKFKIDNTFDKSKAIYIIEFDIIDPFFIEILNYKKKKII